MNLWALFLTASMFFSCRSWTVMEAEVAVVVVVVSGSDGCICWITPGAWKTRTRSFPSVRGPLSPSGVPYPGHLARATTPPTLSKPRPARAAPAPHPSTLKVMRDRRAGWEVWEKQKEVDGKFRMEQGWHRERQKRKWHKKVVFPFLYDFETLVWEYRVKIKLIV